MVAAVDGRVARIDEQGTHVSAEVQAIEAFFRRRFGRGALYLPSARLGLYLVFREWLRPGDRFA